MQIYSVVVLWRNISILNNLSFGKKKKKAGVLIKAKKTLHIVKMGISQYEGLWGQIPMFSIIII